VEFASRVARAVRSAPGIVAVFPALSSADDGSGKYVNGLGDYLARETTDLLVERGIDPLAGEELVNDLYAVNRGLGSFRGLEDVYLLAERLGASYAVFGEADKISFDKLRGDEILRIRWQCRRLADRAVVALADESLRGPLANLLYEYSLVESDWKIGARARPFVPSLSLEEKYLLVRLSRRLAARAGKVLDGSVVAVGPFRVAAGKGAKAGGNALAEELGRAAAGAFRRALELHRLDGRVKFLPAGEWKGPGPPALEALKGRGFTFLLSGTLEPRGNTYRIQVVLKKLDGGVRFLEYVDFDPSFRQALEEKLGLRKV